MEALIEAIEGIIEEYAARGDETIFQQKKAAESLTDLLGSFDFTGLDWRKFVHFDKQRYTRNLIAQGRDGGFGLMILAWGPGQRSPIHNHNGSHCVMRVLQGQLIETLYCDRGEGGEGGVESDTSLSASDDDDNDTSNTLYTKTSDRLLECGQTAYIHDRIGWHRVSNASSDHPAVSIHLYAPPIEYCKTFCEVEGKIRAQAACPYYSIGGILIEKKK